jgi:hypothetical protein
MISRRKTIGIDSLSTTSKSNSLLLIVSFLNYFLVSFCFFKNATIVCFLFFFFLLGQSNKAQMNASTRWVYYSLDSVQSIQSIHCTELLWSSLYQSLACTVFVVPRCMVLQINWVILYHYFDMHSNMK